MAVSFNWKLGSLAALAAGLAFASLPAAAQAQEDGRRWQGGARDGGSFQRPERPNRNSDSGWRAERGERQRAERPVPSYRAPPQVQTQIDARAQAQAQPRWQGGNGEGRPGTRTRGDGSWSGQTRTETRAANSGWEGSRRAAPASAPSNDRVWARNSDDDRRRDSSRNDDNRRAGEGWRGSNDRWRDNDRSRESWRDDNRRDGYRDGYRDARRDWNRDWRRDNRYNWYSYRTKHRNHYRLGSYYAPYRNYSYRRLSIGFHLDSLFFSSRYWIADPWAYRLPPAYGPYRWVRYYDDVLLVDIYSGEVIDVIHGFFW